MTLNQLRTVCSNLRGAILFSMGENAVESHNVSDCVCVACGHRTVTADHSCAWCGADTNDRLFGEPAADRLTARAMQSAETNPGEPDAVMRLVQLCAGAILASGEMGVPVTTFMAAAQQMAIDLRSARAISEDLGE